MINVDDILGYVEEHKLPLLRNAVIGSRTSKEFNLLTGVKSNTVLNLLETSVTFGDGASCGWDQRGYSTLTQRILVPGNIKINMSFCDKLLLKTWMNYEVKVAAGQKTLPFEQDFMAGVAENIAAELEKAIWQGDTTGAGGDNLTKFDGMIKIMNNATAGATYNIASGDSVTTVINKVYAGIPSAAYSKGEVVIYCGTDKYRTYIQELIANGNLVITTSVNDVAMPDTILIPGTNVRVIGVAGLDGTNKYYGSYKDNFVYGCDLQGDEEKMELWYSQDNREFRLAVEFVAGTQVAYPDMVSVAK